MEQSHCGHNNILLRKYILQNKHINGRKMSLYCHQIIFQFVIKIKIIKTSIQIIFAKILQYHHQLIFVVYNSLIHLIFQMTMTLTVTVMIVIIMMMKIIHSRITPSLYPHSSSLPLPMVSYHTFAHKPILILTTILPPNFLLLALLLLILVPVPLLINLLLPILLHLFKSYHSPTIQILPNILSYLQVVQHRQDSIKYIYTY
mmetsp:Transcript_21749/g.30511  ORF Transcript_21749/g.30511 Transcript_21749/m.30511 type:complete len:202 (+) Transcript_21749:705-1310(+)